MTGLMGLRYTIVILLYDSAISSASWSRGPLMATFLSSSCSVFFFSFLPFAPFLFTLSLVVPFRPHLYEAARSIGGQ